MNPDTYSSSPRVIIIGCGSWGTSLSSVLIHTASAVTLVGRNPEVIDDINSNHRNERYLPDAILDPSIMIKSSYEISSYGIYFDCTFGGQVCKVDPF